MEKHCQPGKSTPLLCSKLMRLCQHLGARLKRNRQPCKLQKQMELHRFYLRFVNSDAGMLLPVSFFDPCCDCWSQDGGCICSRHSDCGCYTCINSLMLLTMSLSPNLLDMDTRVQSHARGHLSMQTISSTSCCFTFCST